MSSVCERIKITKDFLPECEINQGTTFPILPIRCHCGNRIGCRQREIEFRIGIKLEELKHLSHIDRFAQARRETFKDMGFTRICCLTSVTLYMFYPIHDSEGMNCIIDCTSLKNNDGTVENNYLQTNSKKVPFELISLKKSTVGFNMSEYSKKIYKITTSIEPSSDKVYATFPMLNTKRIPYPDIETQYQAPKFDLN